MKPSGITVIALLSIWVSLYSGPLNSGIDKSNMDPQVRPQDDLYLYTNGMWLERTEIPPDLSNFGAFMELTVQNEKRLREIIEDAAGTDRGKAGSETQQVGDFYLSFMDTSTIEKLGLRPLQADLKRIEQLKSRDELAGLIAYFMEIGVQTPFIYYINQDQKQSDRYIGYVYQSGLGLPDRDYYFTNEEKFREIRQKYVTYIDNLLSLAGQKDPSGKAQLIFQLEKELAEGHWTRVENRDRDKTYNKYTLQELDQLTPHFSWSRYIQAAGIQESKELVVHQPGYLQQFNQVLGTRSLEDWKSYFTFKLLDDRAPYLTETLVQLNFDFKGRTLSGIEEISPRWKRAVNTINDAMGEAVGKLYVAQYFKPEAKERMLILVENLRKAYAERLGQLDWMSPETKAQAQQKLSKFTAKIGYPDKWKDYSGLVIHKEKLVENYKQANIISYRREIAKLGKPIDRQEWFMTPQNVNAYYNPTMNEVVFPAAILQPPFFNLEADEAVNYGAIGAVIGHEMTHGFDDQGRKSDGDGNLRDWWTEEDVKRFTDKAQILVKQYSQYTPIDTFRLNGELTLGENIADLGGLTISYHAYQLALEGKTAPVVDGFTGEQRFFLGWSQVWRRKYREAELRKRLLTDPHSPSQYRVNGVVVNMPEFYQTFQVTETDHLYLPEAERVLIW